MTEHLALAGIAFLGALIFGVTGFGSGLVTIPLATHLVPLPFALAMFAVADLASALRVGLEKPRNAVRSEWTRLVPMILVGTALGLTVLVNLPRPASMALLGAFVLCYALYSLVHRGQGRIVSPRWAWVAGFTGGINWYRNFSRNWQRSEGLDHTVRVPSLMIMAENDAVLPPSAADGMEKIIPDLEKYLVRDCGHWTQQEKPEEVSAKLIEWRRKRFG